jgi:hypothetical protein
MAKPVPACDLTPSASAKPGPFGIRIAASMLLAAAFVLFWSAPIADAVALAGVYPADSTLNCGTIARGAKVRRTVTIWNPTPNAYRIDSVASSCGCTTTGVLGHVIEPFKPTQIPIELETQGLPNRFEKALLISLEPKRAKSISIRLVGTVYEPTTQEAMR